jgi:hypothetical protein
MDPYLEDEALWADFHPQLVGVLRTSLSVGLVDRYRTVVGHRRYALGGQDCEECYLEIRQNSDGRLVTLLDVLSPANKTTAAGRQAYQEQRQKAREAGANLAEIDLVLQGQPPLDYGLAGLPPWDYAVIVARVTSPQRYEIYTSTLEKRLPHFRLPLAPDDRDTVVDLQTAFTCCYEEGRYFERIDYRREPRHNQIARVAFFIWEQEERPNGRDKEHWHRALARLRPDREAGPDEA